MAAGKLNIVIEQGALFTRTLAFFEADGTTPIPVTGWAFSGQLRARYDSDTSPATFTFTDGLNANEKTYTLTPEETAAIPVDPSVSTSRTSTDYLYDLFADKGGDDTERVVEGVARVSPRVTKV